MKHSIYYIPFWVMLAVAALYSTALAHEDAGYIKSLEGSAVIVRGESSIPAKLGDPVQMNDTVITKPDGSLGITFMDSTRISIGPDTEFIINNYVYKPKEKQLSFVSKIGKGTLHFISGNMSKLKEDAVELNTPEGTVGIRGTRFLVKVE